MACEVWEGYSFYKVMSLELCDWSGWCDLAFCCVVIDSWPFYIECVVCSSGMMCLFYGMADL